MKLRIPRVSRLAATLLALPLLSLDAAAQIAVSANDNKAVLVNGTALLDGSRGDQRTGLALRPT